MILQNNLSLGIDISEDFISFAFLKKSSKGTTLVKAGRMVTPSACMSQGNITDHTILGKAIKELLNKHRVKAPSASVSLLAHPTLSQIITLPDEQPSNIDSFIQGEIKNSSILAGKEYCYDFCLLSSNARSSECKVLAQAASSDRITPTVKAINSASMRLSAIELPFHAWVRAAYEKYIVNNYDRNTVVLFSRSSQTHISVFRKGRLDFVRSLDFDCNSIPPDEYREKVFQELKAVIQYYDIEVESEGGVDWQILLYLNNCDYSNDVIGRLNEFFNCDIELCSDGDIIGVFSENSSQAAGDISSVAVGLALRELRTVSSSAMINLVPRDVVRISLLKRSALLITNFAAVVMVAIFILTGIKAAKAIDIDKAMAGKYHGCSAESIGTLTERYRSLDDLVKNMEEQRLAISGTELDACDIHWSVIMDIISQNIPVDMCVSKMMCSSHNTMSLHGDSLAYESPYILTDLLVRSDQIDSATVTEISNHPTDEKMIAYRIDCKIRRNGRVNQDVD